MNRRDILKAIAVFGASMAFTTYETTEVMAQTVPSGDKEAVDMVAVMGGEPADMLQKALPEIGGIGRYVKTGAKVVVKPNMGWDKLPEQAANTNPELLMELIRQCFAAGAAEVALFDHTCDEWSRCYKNSGIEEAAKAAGAKVLPAHEEIYFRSISLPSGVVLQEAKVHQAILDSDVWFNVPVLKHHGGTNLTIAMKNYMGVVWDRKFFHRHNLQQCIADICTMPKRPALNIVDAYRVVKSNGPRGRSTSDVVMPKALFISEDIVAVDTVATKFFSQIREMSLENVAHIAHGQELKIGTMNTDSLNIKRIKM